MSIPWQIVVESWDRQQNSAATSLKTPVTAQLPDTSVGTPGVKHGTMSFFLPVFEGVCVSVVSG